MSEVQGSLTHSLIERLRESDTDLSYDQLDKYFSDHNFRPIFLGENSNEIVFINPLEAKIHNDINKAVFEKPIRELVDSLKSKIERSHEKDPEDYLDLGIALAALGRYEESKDELEKAIDQRPGRIYPEAHYQKGRVLYEEEMKNPKGGLEMAIGELRTAGEQYENDSNMRMIRRNAN